MSDSQQAPSSSTQTKVRVFAALSLVQLCAMACHTACLLHAAMRPQQHPRPQPPAAPSSHTAPLAAWLAWLLLASAASALQRTRAYARLLTRLSALIDASTLVHVTALPVCGYYFVYVVLSSFGLQAADLSRISEQEWLLVIVMTYVLGRHSGKLDMAHVVHSAQTHLRASHALLTDMLPEHVVKRMLSGLIDNQEVQGDPALEGAAPAADLLATADGGAFGSLFNTGEGEQVEAEEREEEEAEDGSGDVWATANERDSSSSSTRSSSLAEEDPEYIALFLDLARKASALGPLLPPLPERRAGFTSPTHAAACAPFARASINLPVAASATSANPAPPAHSCSVDTCTSPCTPTCRDEHCRTNSGGGCGQSLPLHRSSSSESASSAAPAPRLSCSAAAACVLPEAVCSLASRQLGRLRSGFSRRTSSSSSSSSSAQTLSPRTPLARPSFSCHDVATSHPCVTLFFSDIVGFSTWAHHVPPAKVMSTLNELYSRLDDVILHEMPSLYKVETIGDAYVMAANLLVPDPDHAATVTRFALRAQQEAAKVLRPDVDDGSTLQMRIGIHTGPVVSGVVGKIRQRFCLFGDTMNMAARTESSCPPGCIQLTASARDHAAPALAAWPGDACSSLDRSSRGSSRGRNEGIIRGVGGCDSSASPSNSGGSSRANSQSGSERYSSSASSSCSSNTVSSCSSTFTRGSGASRVVLQERGEVKVKGSDVPLKMFLASLDGQ